MTDNIKINDNTRATLINLSRTISEAQERIQGIGIAYLDALGEDPAEWQLKQDFSEFEKKPEPVEDPSL